MNKFRHLQKLYFSSTLRVEHFWKKWKEPRVAQVNKDKKQSKENYGIFLTFVLIQKKKYFEHAEFVID